MDDASIIALVDNTIWYLLMNQDRQPPRNELLERWIEWRREHSPKIRPVSCDPPKPFHVK